MSESLSPAPVPWDQFQGVVFDLDGTLLDTLTDIASAANSVLAQHQFPTHPLAAYRQFVGEGVRVLMSRALPPAARNEATLEAVLETMAVEYARHFNQTTRPYPGIPEMLAQLKSRHLKLAVLSNKPHAFTGQCVTEFFEKDLFEPILGLRPDRPRKPDPAGALEIATSWGIPPSRTLYLGDSGTDMETARRAGMFPVGVLWGYRDAAELLKTGAQRLITRPAELLG